MRAQSIDWLRFGECRRGITVSAAEPAGERRGGRGRSGQGSQGGKGGKGRGQGGGRGGQGGGGRGQGGRPKSGGNDGPRKKVDRKIQIGIVVPPDAVLDRAQHSRVLQIAASSAPLTERIVTP